MRNIYAPIKNVLLIPLFFLLLMAISMAGQAQEVTISTDKLDYYPGEWVTITGSGWQAEEFVMISLIHTGEFIPAHQHLPFDVQANAAGDLYYKWYVSDAELGTAFLLTARGLNSGWEAETSFTDSQIDGITPNLATEGTPFTITGVGFGSGAETFKACFGSVCIDLVRIDTKTFTGVIPSGLTGGQYNVTVYNKQDNNSVGSPLADGFTYCVNSTAPEGATAATAEICPGDNTELSVSGGSLGTQAEWKWYSGSCGGTAVGSGATITVSPTVTTTYYVRAEGDCNTTTCASVTVTLKSPSVAATSATTSADNFCPGGSAELGITGGTLGTGASWKWYSGSCGGTVEGTGATITVSPTVTTTYYVRAEGDCNKTTCASVTVNVKTLSVAATSATSDINNVCPGTEVSLSPVEGVLGTGAAWKWYTGSCGETLAGTGASLKVNPTVTTTYYVRAEGDCNTTTCVSVTVNVKTLSVAATSATKTKDNFCPGGSTELGITGGTLGTGAAWKWYSGSCGGTAEGTGATLNVSPTVTTTYYVRAEGDCNTTDCASVIVTVKTPSVAATTATTSADNFCPGGKTNLGITGGTLGTGADWKWYTGSCGETLAGTGATLEVSPSVTTTYFVRAEGDCNTTDCASVTVTVKTPSVAATTATTSADYFCPGGKTNLGITGGTLGTGAAWKWYSGSCGGTAEGTGATLEVSPTVTTTYFVRAEGDCNTTDCASVTVNVKTLSVAASSASSDINNVCPGTEVSLSPVEGVLGTGASWKWYTGSCGGTAAGTGASLKVYPTVTNTYYVRAEGDCNTTDCAEVTITVKKPTTIGTDPKNAEIVYGCDAPILSVVADGEGTLTYQWYKNTTKSNSGGTKIIDANQNTYQTPFNYNVGNFYYYAEVTGECGTVASDVATVTITPQIAMAVGDIYYTGPEMAWTTSPSSNTATVTLTATIKNGEPCGDIRTARITFTVDGRPIPSAQNLPVSFIDPNNPAMGGTASAIVQLNISSTESSKIFDIGVDISGNYTSGNFTHGDVTIIKPKPGGVIGGGAELCNNNSAGYVKGSGVSRLNFYVEYAMKGKSATNPKGKVSLLVGSLNRPDGTVDNTMHWYAIKSNAIASLNITSPTATFSSKANISEFNPLTGATTAIEGGCVMVLDLKDVSLTGTSNTSDLAGITIYRNGGGVWYSNNWVLTKTVVANICGGDITVTGAPSSATLKSAEIGVDVAPVAVFEPTLKVYPNPFTEKLNIEFSYATDTKAKLEIYSITGAKLQTLYDGPVTGGQLYNFEYLPRLVSSQVLFYHLTLDGKTQVGKILYNERR